ncbi:MAG: hypothetical protein Q4B31_00425 [Clostridia bacterium]|nr:hypothetical protein [Clostridia bacterium]
MYPVNIPEKSRKTSEICGLLPIGINCRSSSVAEIKNPVRSIKAVLFLIPFWEKRPVKDKDTPRAENSAKCASFRSVACESSIENTPKTEFIRFKNLPLSPEDILLSLREDENIKSVIIIETIRNIRLFFIFNPSINIF